jgi:hypothetical protein
MQDRCAWWSGYNCVVLNISQIIDFIRGESKFTSAKELAEYKEAFEISDCAGQDIWDTKLCDDKSIKEPCKPCILAEARRRIAERKENG